MKAVCVHAYGPPDTLVLDDVPDPSPGAGELVVAVHACGVNPADLKFRSGALSAVMPLAMPFVPGMDIAGTVMAVGEGVSAFRPGDRVLAMLYLMGNGGYAERVALPADWCAPLPPGLDLVTAAALPTPATTAVEWIEDDIRPGPGDRLLVTGAAGAVGLIACHVARRHGAHVTAAVRRSAVHRVCDADDILLLDGDEAPAPGSYDAIADAVGGATATRLLPALKRGGLLSTIATDPVGNPDGLEVAIRFFGNRPDAGRLAGIAQDVAGGVLRLPAPQVMPLADAAKAHARMESGGAGKIVLVPGDEGMGESNGF